MASPIDGESMELEVKHKDNGSWHPCRVSLSSSDSKSGIIVNFENSNEEDIISNREDALARLRFRSTPLQNGECSHIKEGDSVLAMYKDQFRSMFFDAVIEEPRRVQHSNRVFCRCTFEIKWLNPELKEETMTIPSKSIMKLSGEEIGKHPIFAAFLDALSPKDGVESPSSTSLVEETNSETDLQGILEKQIEEISKLVDGSLEFSADLLEAKRVKLGGRKHSKAVVTSTGASNHSQNNFRRSTRSQHKEQTEVELKKELGEDKPFLSPLAARAAFASLLHGHELPLKQELSFSHAEKEDQQSLVQNNSKKHIKMHSHNVTYENMECASSKNIIPDLSNNIQDEDDDAHVKSRGTSRYAKQKGTQKNTKPKESPYIEKPLEATEESEGEKSSVIVNEVIDTTKVGKLSGRTMMTRVTRSSVSKEKEVLSGGVKEGSSDGKLTSPVNTARKTRSSVHKELEASLDETKQESSVEKLTSPVYTTRLTQSRTRNQKEQSNQGVNQEFRRTDLIQDTNGVSEESEGKKGRSSTIINNLIDLTRGEKLSGQSIVTRVTRSSVHKQIEASSDEEKLGSSSKKLTCHTVRLTRSRIQKEQSDAGVDGNLSENIDDISEDITPRMSQSNKKRSISSPSDPSTEPSQETNKRTRASHFSTVATEDSSAISLDSKNASVDKKKDEKRKAISSKQPVLRSSPRLNSLPKTRSQKKD